METRFCTEIPRSPSSRLCMDEDATTNRTKWCLVEVKGPLEKFPRNNPWIEHGLTEKIEGEFSLGQKKVPCWKPSKLATPELQLGKQLLHNCTFRKVSFHSYF
jgi:hypothetical protein